jgi:hypothetical protein
MVQEWTPAKTSRVQGKHVRQRPQTQPCLKGSNPRAKVSWQILKAVQPEAEDVQNAWEARFIGNAAVLGCEF